MTVLPEPIASITNVCDVTRFAAPGNESGAPSVLLEVPHGATKRSDYERARGLMRGDLPPDLADYFFANTDVGSTEFATAVAELVCAADTDVPAAAPELQQATGDRATQSVLLVRCLLPRTLIDTNRIIDSGSELGEVTAGIADYVRDVTDRQTLIELHRQYHAVVERAFAWVCEAGGLAMTPHTYAPKAIFLADDEFDEGIGQALRRAYAPERYNGWETRPPVDVISEDASRRVLASPELVAGLRKRFATIDVDMAENASYRLHPATMGHRYSERYPGQVLCIEVRRDLLGDPFTPFDETVISEKAVRRLAAPVAVSLLEELARRSGASRQPGIEKT